MLESKHKNMSRGNGKNNPNWKSKKYNCNFCKKEIYLSPSIKKEHNFCNKKCFGAWMSEYKIGTKANNWRGGVKVNKTYRKIHKWVEEKLGKPNICELCGEINLKGHKIHWANLSGNYILKTSDWIRLCASCHKKYDIGLITI